MDLQDYRKSFDRIDAELTRLFAERMALSAQVAAYKKKRGLPVPTRRARRKRSLPLKRCFPMI